MQCFTYLSVFGKVDAAFIWFYTFQRSPPPTEAEEEERVEEEQDTGSPPTASHREPVVENQEEVRSDELTLQSLYSIQKTNHTSVIHEITIHAFNQGHLCNCNYNFSRAGCK